MSANGYDLSSSAVGRRAGRSRGVGVCNDDGAVASVVSFVSGGCTHVAMESTGMVWVSIWNVLEGWFKLLLANAWQLKGMPGRKGV